MKFNLRQAQIEDSGTIAEMVQELATYEKLQHQAIATREQFARFGFDPHSFFQVLLAEDEEKTAIGFALYFFTFSTFEGQPTLKLEDLFVIPDYRGKGIGLALLKELAIIALSKECARVEWDVLDWNQPAIEFYQKLGAVPLDGWTTYRLKGEALRTLAGK